MGEVLISATETVLIRATFPAGEDGTETERFLHPQESADDRCHELWLDRQAWFDLGKPDVVTVKVTAGDTLNAGSVTHDHGGDVAEHTHTADGLHAGPGPAHSHDDEA